MRQPPQGEGSGAMADDNDRVSQVARGVRIDLLIAVCALLISSLAAGASWWQARVLSAQTEVLQEQLGAQVWPYVTVNAGINSDTVRFGITNQGLGPAVLRSASVLVDGVPRVGFTGLLHAILGPKLIARSPHGERLGFTVDSGPPGSVIRPGEETIGFSFTSKRYAGRFLAGYRRMSFQICYCAIIPGKCWRSDSATTKDPEPVQSCPEIPNDLLHTSALDEILSRNI